ncbi:DUF4422 domain-containing protein, partial [Bifidobacterium saguinibicoloris]|uniref:DUF4422 domain-containing protein n=1 Tax=Bifidobacterium saguinibicoloris TaxID=2834433 RepID=UPI001C571BB7
MSVSPQPKRIRIFVAAHTPATFPDCASILPIQVGAELAEAEGRPLFEDTLHDNDGEHISELNPMYSELTAMYWAWKNVDTDYYGFCQYRRYLDFASTAQAPHQEDELGEVPAGYIDAQSIAEYGLDDGTIAHAVEGWDVVTGPLVDVRRLHGFMTLKEQWDADPHLRLRDLRHMYDVLCARHPEYRVDADAVLDGHTLVPNNMFVMRKGLFHAYCAWLFPLLDEFMAKWDHAHADVETLRTPGHLAERLLTIWLAHLARVGVASVTSHTSASGDLVPADVHTSVKSVAPDSYGSDVSAASRPPIPSDSIESGVSTAPSTSETSDSIESDVSEVLGAVET